MIGGIIGSAPGSSSGGGGAPSGAAGGELAGTYPNPTVKDAVIDDANIVAGGLTNAAISASAAIAASKLAAIPESGVTNLTSDLALKAPLASPTFTGTVTLPSGLVLPASVSIPTSAAAVTQAPADNSTKVATTAYADAIAALKANLASPTFTGTPAGPTPAANDNSTKLATTAALVAQTKLSGGVGQLGPNTFSSIPMSVAGTQIVQSNAGDGKWFRVMMAQSGTLHDVSFLVTTTGGNYNILVLDDGQANATHTTRTCLAIKGSTATPAATNFVTFDPALAVNAGDTLVFMMTYDGVTAKMAAAVGTLAAVALPASFFPGSGASTASTKLMGTCLSASVPAAVNGTVTDANMPVAANGPFVTWRIT